jgi:hypothetical protein
MRGRKTSSSLRTPRASLVVGSAGFFESAPIQSDKSNKRCADNDHQTEEDRSGDEDGVFHIVGTMDQRRPAGKTHKWSADFIASSLGRPPRTRERLPASSTAVACRARSRREETDAFSAKLKRTKRHPGSIPLARDTLSSSSLTKSAESIMSLVSKTERATRS